MLFWLAVVIFGAASWFVIRYAQGYRYDFSTNRFVHTGALAVTANTDAELFVNNKLIGSLSFLGHRAGDDNLLPGTYSVRLVRDGYSLWRKDVTVTEGELADFPAVLLLPTDDASIDQLRTEAASVLKSSHTLADATPTPTPVPKGYRAAKVKSVTAGNWTLTGTDLKLNDGTASGSLIAQNVLGFMPSSGSVLWWTRNELWVYWTSGTNDQPFRTTGDREMVTRWAAPIVRAAWFRDGSHIVVDLGPSGYRVVETDLRGGVNIIRL